MGELEVTEIETRDVTSKACACCCSTVQGVKPQPMAWAPLAALAACAGGLVGGSVAGLCVAKQKAEQPAETTDVTIVNSQINEEIVVNSVNCVHEDYSMGTRPHSCTDPDVAVVELDATEIETRDITSKACACCCSTVQKVEPQPMAWGPLAALATCTGSLVGGSVIGLCVEQPVEKTDDVT